MIGRYWPHIVGGVLIALLLVVVKGWHDKALRLPAVEKQRDTAIAAKAKYETDLTRELARTRTISQGLQDELQTIRGAARAQPAPVVRLCNRTVRRDLLADRAAGPGADEAAAAGGQLPETDGPGRDIGPELYAIADDADEIVASCRALQGYVRTLPR